MITTAHLTQFIIVIHTQHGLATYINVFYVYEWNDIVCHIRCFLPF